MDCIFCKIAKKEVPAEFYLDKEDLMVIKNIKPEAAFHALVIPKKHLKLDLAQDNDALLLGKMILAAKQVAEEQNLSEGYRLIINNGENAGQEIEHLHLHLLGGERLWPLNQ